MGTNITGIGNANAIGFKSRVTGGMYFPPELKDALVGVWSAYGKSNDSTDRNIIKNKIKDRGGDFVISNAAFKLNSGFGLYATDFTTWSRTSVTVVTDKSAVFHPTSKNQWLLSVPSGANIPALKLNVKGITDRNELAFQINSDEGSQVVILKNGINDIPSFTANNTSGIHARSLNITDWGIYEVDQIPSFQGALVTDGVDDMIRSQKTIGEMLEGSTEFTIISMIHLIDVNPSTMIGSTNYMREPSTSNFTRVDSKNIDKTGIYGIACSNINTWTTTTSSINNILGDNKDYNFIVRGTFPSDSRFYVTGYSHNSGIAEISQVAWYWTIIANRVLTADEINQVIAYYNLDRTLNPDILCNTIKQGITNENHAEFGDKLIDFSGNGRDIQLNNIAWKGDSGIGKYAADFTDTVYNKWLSTYNSFSIKFSKVNQPWRLSINTTKVTFPSMKVSVKGIMDEDLVQYHYYDGSAMKYLTLNNGEITLPDSKLESGGINHLTGFWANVRSDTKVTITQIPSHAGALCLDGINDFGKVTGMPVYKDYTVVTDREIFANAGAISSKNNPGAFVETAGNSVYSFGQATSDLNFISTRSISYLSKYSYCGQSITAGAAEDGTDMWLGTIRDKDTRFFNGAIYSLMSFPYSMSEFLIERQLKKYKLSKGDFYKMDFNNDFNR